MTPTPSHDHMKLDDHDHQHQFFIEKSRPSPSTMSAHVSSYSHIQDHGSYYPREAYKLKYHQEAKSIASEGGSSSDHGLKVNSWRNQGYQINGQHHQNIPTKLLPTKLRFVRRMSSSDHTATEAPATPLVMFQDFGKQGLSTQVETTENSGNSSSCTPIRVCSDCNTTKTPLWRSGPRGPKSLCNACGIRQRKARRALALAAAAANGTTLEIETPKPKVQQKDKNLKINTENAPCKKRSKISNNNGRKHKLCFEDFLINLSKNLDFHKVFPQDEKEAAILLMALSCDLVHG